MNKKLYFVKAVAYTVVYGIVTAHLLNHTMGGALVALQALKDIGNNEASV